MNYTGGKYKLLPQLLPHFPANIHTFVDLFCGGCNVGINVKAGSHIYNDACTPLIHLYQTMKDMDAADLLDGIYRIIDDYALSLTSVNGYAYYGCESSSGLGAYNKPHYLHLREDFNGGQERNAYDIMFYVLIRE